jgi:molybdate transport system ATP-binding protein
MVYVSHSLSEVMALADTALVVSEGRQVVHGKASHVLVHPDVIEIADYASLKNILQAQVVSTGSDDGLADVRVGDARVVAPDIYRQPGDDVMISIRAGDIILALDVPPRLSAQNVISASIEEIHVIGSRVLVYLGIGVPLVAEITPNALRELDLREGQQVYVIIKTNSIVALDTPDEVLS